MLQLLFRPSLHLHACLLLHLLVSCLRPVLRPFPQRNRQRCQLRHRFRIPLLELIPLLSSDSCHQRQMIVRPPPLIALPKPPAHIAVLHRFRIRFPARILTDCLQQSLLHMPVIRRILQHRIFFARVPLAWWHHPQKLRQRPLNLLKQIRVQRQLQDCRCFRLSRQLRVCHFVRPSPPIARLLHPPKHIRPPNHSPSLSAPCAITSAPRSISASVSAMSRCSSRCSICPRFSTVRPCAARCARYAVSCRSPSS